MFTEQILIFQEGLFVRRTDDNSPGRCICSPNRYHFFQGRRKVVSGHFLATEQIQKINFRVPKHGRKSA